MVARGKFRQDLFSASSHPINVPPLRNRPDDLPLLLQHFIEEAAQSPEQACSDTAGGVVDSVCRSMNFRQRSGIISLVYNAVAQHRSGPCSIHAKLSEAIRKEQQTLPPQESKALKRLRSLLLR